MAAGLMPGLKASHRLLSQLTFSWHRQSINLWAHLSLEREKERQDEPCQRLMMPYVPRRRGKQMKGKSLSNVWRRAFSFRSFEHLLSCWWPDKEKKETHDGDWKSVPEEQADASIVTQVSFSFHRPSTLSLR